MRAKPDTNFDFLKGFLGGEGLQKRSRGTSSRWQPEVIMEDCNPGGVSFDHEIPATHAKTREHRRLNAVACPCSRPSGADAPDRSGRALCQP
jgi:hypothetical protein